MTQERTIIVHIGLPKTGTTSVQNALYRHREGLLERFGILVPSLAANLTTPLCSIFLDDPLIHISNRMLGLGAEDVADLRESYRRPLEDEISRLPWSTLLLSAEGLSNLNYPALVRLRDWCLTLGGTVRVVACVRHPLDYTRSVTQEIMKGGATLGELEQNIHFPNYRGKIGNSIRVFGRDAVSVFDFESMRADPDGMASAFLRRINESVAAGTLAGATSSDNESLSMEAVLLLDSLNRNLPIFVDGRRNPLRSGRELTTLRTIRGRKFQLHPAMFARTMELCVPDIEWLNGEFGLALYPDLQLPTPGHATGQVGDGGGAVFSQRSIDDLAGIIAARHNTPAKPVDPE